MNSRLPLILTGLCLLLALLAGCSGDAPPIVSPTAAPMPPYIPTPGPVLTKWDMSATKEARDQVERGAAATRVASGSPIVITPLVIPTQRPVLTPELGITGACAQADHVFSYGGCWRARTNTEYIFLSTGAFKDDIPQGIVRVYTSTLELRDYGPQQSYRTPTRDGLLHVVAANGFLLTLRAEDGTLFYFDVATRQWVDPPPTPKTSEWTLAPPVPTPPPGETPHLMAGAGIIWQERWSRHFNKLMHVLNQWVETKNNQGQSVLVCAGSRFPREDGEQGVIGVLVQDPSSWEAVSGPDLYMTPQRKGAVRLVDAVGERLTLEAADGTRFYFDVATRQWVNP